MPYPELMVRPMREELSALGVTELKTPDQVRELMESQTGTALVVVNSVCGCAAGSARPAVALALRDESRPAHAATVFAGQDAEATAALREYFPELPPSSPSFILVRDGKLSDYIPRHRIEGRGPQEIAADLVEGFKAMRDGDPAASTN